MILYFLFDVRNVGSWKRLEKSSKKAKKCSKIDAYFLPGNDLFLRRKGPLFVSKSVSYNLAILYWFNYLQMVVSKKFCYVNA